MFLGYPIMALFKALILEKIQFTLPPVSLSPEFPLLLTQSTSFLVSRCVEIFFPTPSSFLGHQLVIHSLTQF